MRWFVALTVVVLVSGPLALGADTQNTRTAFEQANPGVILHMRDGQLTRVFGVPFDFGNSPEESADSFVQAYSELWGVPAQDLARGLTSNGLYTDPLVYEPETGSYKFTLLYYSQYRGGFPVYASDLRLLVLNQPGYPLVWAGSYLRDLGDFAPVVPAIIAEAAAHAAATGLVSGLNSFGASDLVIYAGYDTQTTRPTVAITFIADNGQPATPDYQKWFFVADAATGAILRSENLILNTDVTGSVHGQSTTPPKADACNPEVDMAMKYAKVAIGGTTAYADANGNFTIPNGGTAPVTVTSYMSGKYFNVSDQAGAVETLNLNVTPPGPADFMHNAANTSEYIRSEVNSYIQANVVRDFILTYKPNYPTIATQQNFQVNVNLNSTCNAYYDGASINFYRAGGGCNNTGYSNVVHHEYGHHAVATGGSGQGQYGEGMGDTLGVLIADDPITGYGFYSGQCNSGIRTANNTKQYPCTGEIHDCGQLISGCVWSTRNALLATYPSTYLQILSNLTVNSIPMHGPSDLIAPDITIDFLTIDDDDGNIYNGTPHSNEICAGFNAHAMTCPVFQTGLKVLPAGGLDSQGNAGGPFTPASIDYTLQNIGTTSFNYTVTKTQSWVSLTNPSGSLAPGATVVVNVSINANANGLPLGLYNDTVSFTNTTNHQGDTTRPVTLHVGIPQQLYNFPLDTNPGWTTQSLWAWGTPTGGSGDHGGPDPTAGHTGTKVYGYNLNGGYTNNMSEQNLTTTALDCSTATQVSLRFWRWLGVEENQYDRAYVRVSNNGSTWTTIWSNPVNTLDDQAWVPQSFDISAYADHKPTVYIRWTMGTTDGGWTYCGWNVDDVEIWGVPDCTSPSITGQPQSQKRHVGQTVTFTVTATGTAPLNYQWRKNGGNIGGATSASYTIASVVVGDTGNYDCVVTNSCGSATSNAASLAVWLLGDLDCDGLVNFSDIDPFVLALSGQAGYEAQFPNCYYFNGDCNNDGNVDFADIDPFVALLGG